MSDELREIREALEQPIRNYADLDGAMLVGWVVLGEWSDPEGERWITKTAGDVNDANPPIWTVKGWLYHALDTAQRDSDADSEEEPDGDER